MIWPFKKRYAHFPKHTIPDRAKAVRLFKETLAAQGDNGRAQIVIALRVTPIHLAVFQRALKEEGNPQPFEIGHMLPVLAEQLEKASGEISPRRLGWLNIAGMLYYLCHPEDENVGPPAVQDDLVEIFIMLADAAYVIPNIIEYNALWKDYEKDLFPDDYSRSKEGVLSSFLMPALRAHPKIQSYAKENRIYL